MQKFLLYGAYGYTGKLIADAAADYDLTPILAGRDAHRLEALSEQTGYPYMVVSLDDTDALEDALDQVSVVIHAAGPFKYTAEPMIRACIHTNTHYLDITGEIEAFALAHSYDQAAREADVMLLPGTGFDVVPTDCLALHLKKQLPDATHLQLAFATVGGGVSHGTALTAVENLSKNSWVRRDGRLAPVPVGHKTMRVPFPDKERFVMTIPWGDVFTAWHTTGIPNIETYMGIHPKAYRWMKWQKYFNWLLSSGWIKKAIKKRIDRRPAGPGSEQRAKSYSVVWGRVSNAAGEEKTAQLKCANGYSLTAMASLNIVRKVLEERYQPGFQTPAGMYGERLIMEMEGSEGF